MLQAVLINILLSNSALRSFLVFLAHSLGFMSRYCFGSASALFPAASAAVFTEQHLDKTTAHDLLSINQTTDTVRDEQVKKEEHPACRESDISLRSW